MDNQGLGIWSGGEGEEAPEGCVIAGNTEQREEKASGPSSGPSMCKWEHRMSLDHSCP